MQIAKNTVVTLTFELLDADGNMIEKADSPIAYLHGGYQGIFPLVEQALDGKKAGDSCKVRLAPNDAFGEYDAELVQVESRDKFPPEVAVGMQFEGRCVRPAARNWSTAMSTVRMDITTEFSAER